jgi:GT2 family glycosyltransferase
MRMSVTAIIVASNGSAWLSETLAALASQTRAPDRIIAVDNGSRGNDGTAAMLAGSGAERIVTSRTKLPFGQALDLGMSTLSNLEGDEWLWFLTHDSSPEPDALERILDTVQRAPSVAVAGPKIVDWNDPSQIIEIGQTITKFGKRWQLNRPELDQEQYDDQADVMAVGPAGMLVRREVWRQLGGFDAALPVYDDSLDFSIRARLAGHRVVIAPDSRMRFGGDGAAGPRISRRRSVMRHNYRADRSAQLYRRLVYAPAILSTLFWLWMPVLGVLRMVWSLIREQPGRIGAEFMASMAVFFKLGAVGRARRELRRTNTSGWGAIRQLRVDPKTVRTVRMIDREAILIRQGRQPKERHFIATGGLAVLLATSVMSLAMFWWLLNAQFLAGGALLPLSTSVGDLWANTQATGAIPADPFAWVLAVLGTLTFWNPSLAVVVLFALAMPLAAFAAWMWASDVTESPLGRALAAGIWAFSPVLFVALTGGRLPIVLLAVTLPWLLLTASRAAKSWGWAAITSLLAAVVLASAPSLIPAAIVFFVLAALGAGVGLGRVLLVPLVPLVLFAPVIVHALVNGSPLTIFVDPGLLVNYTPGNAFNLLAGFPEIGLGGWPGIFEAIGLTGLPFVVIVGILLAPIAALGLLGLYVTPIRQTLTGVLLAGLGLITAQLAPNMLFASVGSDAVALYTGSGIMLYWLGLATLAASGVAALRKAAPIVTVVAAVGMIAAVAPMLVNIAFAGTQLTTETHRLPAVIRASAQTFPTVGTIVLTAQSNGGVASTLERGTGATLDDQRTARFAGPLTDDELKLAALTGELVSPGTTDVGTQLAEAGIEFIVVAPAATSEQRIALLGTLDSNPDLTSIGVTESGDLWRVKTDVNTTAVQTTPPTPLFQGIWVLQLLVVLGVMLLALPTAEIVDRPSKQPRVGSKKWRDAQRTASSNESETAAELAADLGFDVPATDTVAGSKQPETNAAAVARDLADDELIGDERVPNIFAPDPDDDADSEVTRGR